MLRIDRDYNIELKVNIKPAGMTWFVMELKKGIL